MRHARPSHWQTAGRDRRIPHEASYRGSLILVVMCFVAVLGIGLIGYVALCSRTMQISNRSVQTGLSKQLAEMGLEEALRAFNKNNWSSWSNGGVSVSWDTTTYASSKRAVATITFTSPSAKFGSNVAGASVKIRVDNYDSAQLGAAWSSSANYLPSNLVGYTDGNWYRSFTTQSAKTPSTSSSYWMQEASPISADLTWLTGTTYRYGSMVMRNGVLYRSIYSPSHVASTSNGPPNATYWVSVPYFSSGSDLHYNNETLLYYLNTYWYRYNSSSGWNGYLPTNNPSTDPWTTRWFWASGTTYYQGDTVLSGTTWYRYINSSPTSGNALTNTSYWNTSQSLATSAAAAWNWNTNYYYNLGDAVYYSSRWYRCIIANSGQTPSTVSSYWSSYPLYSPAWDSNRQYSQYDTVRYNGAWYLSLQSGNAGQNPSTITTYWASTSNAFYQWNSTTAYTAGTYCSYSGAWYKCISANTGMSPNNTTYWTSAWAQSSGITTGAPVIYSESTVNLADSAAIKTQLRATIILAPLFPNAAASATNLTIATSGTIDSYDSVTDPSASTRGYSAVLAATNTGSTSTAITIGSADVKGYLAAPSSTASPYAPLYSSGGTVKSSSSPATPNIDLAQISRSPYVPQFTCLPGPTTSSPSRNLASAFAASDFPAGTDLSTVLATNTAIGYAGAVTPARYYYNSGNLNIGSSYTCSTLTINGPVILYVNGSLRIRSGGLVTINETGSAEIHVNGGIKVDSASGGYNNLTKDPKKLVMISDVTSTTTQYYGATTYPFYGAIYIPNTSATLGLEIQTGVQIYGALSAQKTTFSSDATLHYDTSLRFAAIPGVDQPYTVSQWRELTDASELATMP